MCWTHWEKKIEQDGGASTCGYTQCRPAARPGGLERVERAVDAITGEQI